MEKALRPRLPFLALAAGLLLAAGAFAWTSAPCFFRANDYYCYREQAARILAQEGVDAALVYVGAQVSPRTGYAFAHFILHDIGEYAYGTTGDLDEALGYLARYREQAPSHRFFIEYDGFVHGVVSSHLLSEGVPERYDASMAGICADSAVRAGILGDEQGCHHALGHGLVHAGMNRIEPALGVCRSAPTPVAREGCFYGAFMELAFLYLPDYHPGAPRPDSGGGSLQDLCTRIEGEALPECMHFVGQSYLHAHPEDFDGAFATCATLGELGETCANRLGQVVVTSYASSEEEARMFCKKHAGALNDACVSAAIKAIELGFGRESRFWF